MGDGVTPAAWHLFPERDALAEALSGVVAGALAHAVARRGTALLAVSGGTTPGLFFDALSRRDIDWPRVTVTLVDERFVDDTSPRSNAALARARLLRNDAAQASFRGLYRAGETVDIAAAKADSALAPLPWPLDAAILGMGMDGHTASFFPDATNLDTLLSPDRPERVMPVHAASAGEPRLTLPLARLIEAGFLAVHIEGAEKRRALEAALEDGRLPIAIAINAAPGPVPIYWAP